MAADKDKDKGKDKAKAKAAKPPAKDKKPAAEAKEKKKAKDKPKDEAATPVEAAKPAEPAAPRPPADPRLKVLKKFQGRFLPKGPLRDRLKALMTRWDSGEDHGGVTVEELKALLNDWRASRSKAKPAKV